MIVATTIPAVLSTCPQAPNSTTCVPAVQSYIINYKGNGLEGALNDLVLQLGEAGQATGITHQMCLDVARGIRAAGVNIQDADAREAALTLADSLCEQGVETASTGEGDGTPKSISTMGGPHKNSGSSDTSDDGSSDDSGDSGETPVDCPVGLSIAPQISDIEVLPPPCPT